MAQAKNVEKRSRESRIPINGSRNILTVSGIDLEKFHPCWVNDIDDNLHKYLDAGYEFVDQNGEIRIGDRKINTDSQIGAKVSKGVGNGVTAFLMVVPKEYYDEDMAALAAEDAAKEREWQTGLAGSVEGSYGSVKVERK